jgi:hypothetical protein
LARANSSKEPASNHSPEILLAVLREGTVLPGAAPEIKVLE